MTAVRDALRRHTAAAHAGLDGLWHGRDMADRRTYGAFLRGIGAALVPLEAGLTRDGAARLLPDWDNRRRHDALAADLAGLGLRLPTGQPAPVRQGAALFGPLYVLEGSRLGGALMARAVAGSADGGVRANSRFLLHGQGAGFWRSFLDHLEGASPTAPELDAIGRAAAATFALFADAARRELETLVRPTENADA